MDKVLELGKWLLANYQLVISAFVGLASSALAVALLIPGEQPDKFLQSCVDFLSKWSRKPADPEQK